ncbi:MAG: serine protein kinase RIO [Nitrososphaerota archaeon]|nr:serine protein kinase RIO [Nitrososphaerota archaeon]MDG6979116.1 serine protein kinase RIO [Nitrososphaerota archaeon]MDG6981362.1 serine protein kinase RIO [Nitrososphaerota archaeon]MDG7020565.1 serine protein kinase RIO [Nitrososphaerota archaeon]MDG7022090.1 serine protein kinase RIO [Nitrososphaerota archaeon]
MEGPEQDDEALEDSLEAERGALTEGDVEQGAGLRERIRRNERENRRLRHDSNERKTVEEVFDKATNFALSEMIARGDLSYLNGVVRAGKEARVYWGVAPDGSPRAVKIYLTAAAEFKKRMRYVAGDRRFQRLPSSVRQMIRLWVQKEFKNLRMAAEAGIRVPRPYAFNANIIVMEFIGTPPAPAPVFAETEVDDSDYRWTLETVRRLYKAGLVHADLSEFNIFKAGPEERVLFDMGSAILTSHPESRQLLLRDVTNVVRFFKKRGVYEKAPEQILETVLT